MIGTRGGGEGAVAVSSSPSMSAFAVWPEAGEYVIRRVYTAIALGGLTLEPRGGCGCGDGSHDCGSAGAPLPPRSPRRLATRRRPPRSVARTGARSRARAATAVAATAAVARAGGGDAGASARTERDRAERTT